MMKEYNMKYGLSEKSLQKIYDVFDRYPEVEEVVLYGSRARDDYKNGSDIDLTLRGGNTLTHKTLSKIANDLDDQLLPYTIDLSIYSNLKNQDIINQIDRFGVTFYRR